VTRFGIDAMSLYSPRFCVSALDLAEACGRQREVASARLLLGQRAVAPPYEDAVTMAVNAARQVLTPDIASTVELLIVGTESAIDFGKPVSSWVHRHCKLPANCRNFEIKHACYGATGALKMAISWLQAQRRETSALVIATDLTRPFPQEGYEFAGGASAIAMLLRANPRILEIDLDRCGYWTDEVADTFRPTATTEIGDNQISLFSYLDALEGAYDDYVSRCGEVVFSDHFSAHIYHAPFPGMTRDAHRTMLRSQADLNDEQIEDDFARKVKPALHYAQRVGAAYGASNFVCLLGMLRNRSDLDADSRISLFAYGSGCQGEFYEAKLGRSPAAGICLKAIDESLDDRKLLNVGAYRAMEECRQAGIEAADCRPLSPQDRDFSEMYGGRNLLVLEDVRNFRRNYVWS
jgi:hydroxymethylglutaryl-CoA synthase